MEAGGELVLVESQKKKKMSLDHHHHHHPHIPNEIWRLIFHSLIPDIKNLLKLKRVCREWNTIIEDLEFVKSYRIQQEKSMVPYGAVKRLAKANSGESYHISKEAVTHIQRICSKLIRMLTREATKKASIQKVRKISQGHVLYAASHCNVHVAIPPDYYMADVEIPPPSP